MKTHSGRSGSKGRVLMAFLITVGLVVGLFALKKAGLFSQIGPIPTAMLIAGDVFVATLIWYRALKR
jgi:lipopolysaccharide export LptBFGC system permease protein LptF